MNGTSQQREVKDDHLSAGPSLERALRDYQNGSSIVGPSDGGPFFSGRPNPQLETATGPPIQIRYADRLMHNLIQHVQLDIGPPPILSNDLRESERLGRVPTGPQIQSPNRGLLEVVPSDDKEIFPSGDDTSTTKH